MYNFEGDAGFCRNRWGISEWYAHERYQPYGPPIEYEYVQCANVWRGGQWTPVPVEQVTAHDYVQTEFGWTCVSTWLPQPQFNVGGEVEFKFVPPSVRVRGYPLLGTVLAIAGLIVVWHAAPLLVASLL